MRSKGLNAHCCDSAVSAIRKYTYTQRASVLKDRYTHIKHHTSSVSTMLAATTMLYAHMGWLLRV